MLVLGRKARHTNTSSQGINYEGAIVGYIQFAVRDPSTGEIVGATRGFKRHEGGAFEYPIIAPGDGQFFNIAEGINDSGAVVGRYKDTGGFYHGFLLSGGSYTTIDEGGGPNTWVMGINSAGSFVGSFGVQTPPEHGFVSVNGVMTQIDVPGASTTPAFGVAFDGTVVGCTGFANSVTFLRGPQGHFLKFQARNARVTCALGIDNAAGLIVGYYIDQSFVYHGFVYNYVAGLAGAGTGVATPPLITVDYPGAIVTEVVGVNAKGTIAGLAALQSVEPGFIGTPNR